MLLGAEPPPARPEPPGRQHTRGMLPQAAEVQARQVETSLSGGETNANGEGGGKAAQRRAGFGRDRHTVLQRTACPTQSSKKRKVIRLKIKTI